MRTDVEWLIVGAGLHGAHLAVRLRDRGVSVSDIRLVDPNGLFQLWRARTSRLAMSHLRSPSVHNVGLHPMDLETFAGKPRRYRSAFRGRFARPRLKLFDAHCDRVAEDYELPAMHYRGRVNDLELRADGVVATLDDRSRLTARNVVLAVGNPEPKRPPSFERFPHVLDVEWREPNAEPATVLGGGITAVQLALALSARGADVELVARHPIRLAEFDSDPCWIGPACMAEFERVRSRELRRQMISKARNGGTVPSDVKNALCRNRNEGRIRVVVLSTTDDFVPRTDAVYLATGFQSERPGGLLTDRLVKRYDLPVAPCGFPILDRFLRWHDRLWVSGGLAELELGPTARNIVGARRAAERILSARRGSRCRAA